MQRICRRLKVLSLLALSTLLMSCGQSRVDCVLNPNVADPKTITSPIHDPSLIKSEDAYFVYSSSHLGSFYRSDNLREWRLAGQVFEALPTWLVQQIPQADHIGAPDLAFYRGRYLYFYQSHISNTCNAATGLATNLSLDPNSANYQWLDHGLILRSKPHYADIDIYCGDESATFNAIDAHFFFPVKRFKHTGDRTPRGEPPTQRGLRATRGARYVVSQEHAPPEGTMRHVACKRRAGQSPPDRAGRRGNVEPRARTGRTGTAISAVSG